MNSKKVSSKPKPFSPKNRKSFAKKRERLQRQQKKAAKCRALEDYKKFSSEENLCRIVKLVTSLQTQHKWTEANTVNNL